MDDSLHQEIFASNYYHNIEVTFPLRTSTKKLVLKLCREEFIEMGELLPEIWYLDAKDGKSNHDNKLRRLQTFSYRL